VSAAGSRTPPGSLLSRISLTTRITVLAVAVAVASALLSGAAAAALVLAAESADTATATTSVAPGPAAQLRDERQALAAQRREERRAARLVHAGLASVAVGLVVGLIGGASTARVLTRPLRRTADAAHAMSAGRRDVRVPVEGPPEAAAVAEGLNALAEALAASEDRQRRFLLSVSHELRTPLTAVRGFAESIADGVVVGEEARAAGSVVLAESLRLDRLVQDLLDLARLGADDFGLNAAEVDLGDLLAEAAGVWSTRVQARGVELRVERTPAEFVVRTDAARLRQVLDGLAENAVRVTPAGRPVVLALRAGGFADPAGTRAVLEVRDGGPGLTPQDREVAFAPGALGARYRGERPVGVGIGLSLVHGLVARLGGAIAVGEAAEGGARFSIAVTDLPPTA